MSEEQTISKRPVDPLWADRDAESVQKSKGRKSSRRLRGASILTAAMLLLLPGSLVAGAVRHYRGAQSVAATAEQRRDFVPRVRVAAVKPSDGIMTVSLPATTTAFEAANIFARTSGYIEKRYVDIGDRV